MKVLLFDIETAPILSNVWSLWSEARDFKFVDVDWYVLSYSAKWLNDKKTIVKSLPDCKSYAKNKKCDKELLKGIWELLDEADVVVGHNAMKFDCKKLNSRFLINGMLPPSPYKIIDTLLVAKRYFSFTSNRLDTLGRLLNLGKKEDTGGFELWRGCLDGDMKSWRKMCKYNKQDVLLLEKVYLKLRPHIQTHPNYSIYNDDVRPQCPSCGSHDLIKRGYAYTNVSKFSRYRCKNCGKWSRNRVNEISKEKKTSLMVNIT